MSMTQSYVSLEDEQKEKVRNYILSYVEPGWRTKLSPFLIGGEFTKILDELLKKENRPLTPPAKVWFRAFKETLYNDLRVIICAQDPYPQPGIADGLAFSCTTNQPSLQYIHKAIKSTVYNDEEYSSSNDLTSWCKQGVLLFNTALTTKINNSNSHNTIWQPFTEYLFELLSQINRGLIYVLWGAEAQKLQKYIDPFTNYIITAEHPAAPTYRKDKRWDCKDSFNKVNKLLMENNREKIEW